MRLARGGVPAAPPAGRCSRRASSSYHAISQAWPRAPRPAEPKADHASSSSSSSPSPAMAQQPAAAAPSAPPPRATALELATSTVTWRRFASDLARRPLVRDDWASLTSRPWVRGPVEAILGNAALLEAVADVEGAEGESLARLRELVEALDWAWQRLDQEDEEEQEGKQARRQGERSPPQGGGGWLLRRVALASASPSVYALMDVAERALTPDRVARLERLGEGALTAPRLAKLARALHGALDEAGRGGADDNGNNNQHAPAFLHRGALLAARAGRAAVSEPFLEGLLVSLEACADSPDVAALVDAALFGADPAASPPPPPSQLLPPWPSAATAATRPASPPPPPQPPLRRRRVPLRLRDRALLRFAAELDAAVGPSAAVPKRLLALLVRVAGKAAEAAAATTEPGEEEEEKQWHPPPPPPPPPSPEEAAPALACALMPPLLALQPHLPRYDGMARALAKVDALLPPPLLPVAAAPASPSRAALAEPWLRELLRDGRLRRYSSALAMLSVTGGSGGGGGGAETGGSLGAAMWAVARVFAPEPPPLAAGPHDEDGGGGGGGGPSPAASYLDAEEWHHPRRRACEGQHEEEDELRATSSTKDNAAASSAAVFFSALDALADAPEAAGRALDALSLDRRRVEALRLLLLGRRRRASRRAPPSREQRQEKEEGDDAAAGTLLSAAAAALERAIALSGEEDRELGRRIQADDEAYEATTGAYCLYSGPQSEEDEGAGHGWSSVRSEAGPPPPPPASPTLGFAKERNTGRRDYSEDDDDDDESWAPRSLSLAGGALLAAARLLGPERARAAVGAALANPPSPALGRALDALLLLELLRLRRRRWRRRRLGLGFSSFSSFLARAVRQEAVIGARILAEAARGASQ